MQLVVLIGLVLLALANLAVLWQLLRQREQLFGIERKFSAQLEQTTQAKLTSVLDQIALSFSDELTSLTSSTTAELDTKLRTVIEQAITQYERQIVAAREEVLQALNANRTDIEQTQQRAETEVNQALEQYKKEALAKIETKLNSILSSYLLKSLGPVDFSAQQDYILQTLAANKETLRRDIHDAH